MTGDKYATYRPMLDLIGLAEGTDKGDGYNETLAYGAYTGGDVDLVSMTLDQVAGLQAKMLDHPDNHFNSSAIGRYQIVSKTMRSIRKTLKLTGTELYDETMQDRMGCFLMGSRGIDLYLSGQIKENTIINNLAKEWASLPTTSGKGYYGGQNAAVPVSRVRSTLAEVQSRYDGKTEPPELPEPEEPDDGTKIISLLTEIRDILKTK